jgi:hypothetical protein
MLLSGTPVTISALKFRLMNPLLQQLYTRSSIIQSSDRLELIIETTLLGRTPVTISTLKFSHTADIFTNVFTGLNKSIDRIPAHFRALEARQDYLVFHCRLRF